MSFLAFFAGLFFGYIHFYAGPCFRPRTYRLVVNVISVRKLLCYSYHIFCGPNKHDPYGGRRVYLCRF